jgi:hypothetical protein
MRELADHPNRGHLPALRAADDLLASFPELNDWHVWAADGHKISHATHDKRNATDQNAPVNAIYRLEMRTGYAECLTCLPADGAEPHAEGRVAWAGADAKSCAAAAGAVEPVTAA